MKVIEYIKVAAAFGLMLAVIGVIASLCNPII